MKRKIVSGIFILSALILLGSAFAPLVYFMIQERIYLTGMFFELWPLIPIALTAWAFLWLSYNYLNDTEKTSL